MNKEYYIRNKEGKLEQASKEVAHATPTYGIKDIESGHIFEYHSECDDMTCYVCNLSVCMVCGAYEGGLSTECCGKRLSMDEVDRIYNGEVDFRYGRWLEGALSKPRTWKPEDMIENQERIMEIFKEDIEKQTEVGKKVCEDLAQELKAWTKAMERSS